MIYNEIIPNPKHVQCRIVIYQTMNRFLPKCEAGFLVPIGGLLGAGGRLKGRVPTVCGDDGDAGGDLKW